MSVRRRIGPPGWLVFASAVVFAGFVAFVLPQQAGTAAAYTDRAPSPDTRFWYPASALYAAAGAWGPTGRAAYVTARVTFDVIWPLAYGFFLFVTLTWLSARLLRPGSPGRKIAALPIVVVLLDYAENACTALVMARYPALTPGPAELAGFFTAAKWVTLTFSFGLVLIGAGWWGVRTLLRILRRRQT